MGGLRQVDEIADFVAFLASDLTSQLAAFVDTVRAGRQPVTDAAATMGLIDDCHRAAVRPPHA